ncbi:MAG: phosphodiester glycosidase family protein [Eggerthellaceae bacterium]
MRIRPKRKLRAALVVALSAACLCFAAGTALAVSSNVSVPDDRQLTIHSTNAIAPGITEDHITTVDKSTGSGQVEAYMATIDASNTTVGFLASYKNYDDSGKWGMQTVRDQAKAAEKKTGKKVVLAINGDYFNMTTGEPLGLLIMNGKVVHGNGSDAAYFCQTKDGKYDIRWASESYDDVQQAVGSPVMLIQDGNICDGLDATTLMPRAAIGITAEGKIVVYEADGRQVRSVGETMVSTAKQMQAMGCVEAMYLDGGGSATFTSRAAGDSSLTVRNSPSDGTERQVSSSLLFFSDAKADGEFTHAVLSPGSEVYTPGSTVTFSAKGVDDSGGAADVPANAQFVLADESKDFGTIDSATGEFTSNGTCGEVTVNLVVDGNAVGSTTVEVQEPDRVSFVNDEVSLGFLAESDLGLQVKYKNRAINYKDGDFTWDIANVSTDAKHEQLSDLSIGSFSGNTFTSSDGNTLYATVTCSFAKADGSAVSGSVELIVGLQPTVVMDFEDQTAEDGSVIAAKDYWTFDRAFFNAGGGAIEYVRDENGNMVAGLTPTKRMLTGAYHNDGVGRGGNESAEIVSASDGYAVRKGTYAMKLDYDFTNWNGATDGACFGFSDASQEIPGNPTAIGVWVYAPEGTANMWLRCRVKDGTGTTQTVNFTQTGTSTVNPLAPSSSADAHAGIDWTGWQYLEADLSKFSGPFSLIGGETVRVMYLNGCGNKTNTGEALPQSQCKGYMIFDDLSFVYGANVEDVDNPVVGDVTANNKSLEDNTVLTDGTVNFTVALSDTQNKYTSGVNFEPSSMNVVLDGEDLTNEQIEAGNLVADSSKESLFLYNQKLSDGEHSLQVTIRDQNGNEASKTVNFSVDANQETSAKVAVSNAEDEAVLCGAVNLVASADNREAVQSLSITYKLASDFTDYEVEYGEDFVEAAEPSYDKKSNAVTLSVARVDGATSTGEGAVATLKVKVPASMKDGDSFSYSVTKAKYKVGTEDDQTSKSFVKKAKSIPVVARYALSLDTVVSGYNATLTATDRSGEPVRVNVYDTDGNKIGKTDLNGQLTIPAYDEASAISIYAEDSEGFRSFVLSTQAYSTVGNEDGTPTFVKLNAANGATQKNITWLSNPAYAKKKAIAQIATKAAYDAQGDDAFESVEGTCETIKFSGSDVAGNKSAYSCSAVITGLKSGADYVYRVGDGKHWSDVQSTSTCYKGADTSFFILGDTQVESGDMETIDAIAATLAQGNYSFGAQLGDFVEQPTVYTYWESILSAFDNDAFRSTDFIHVMGNHEQYGDDGVAAKKLFNITSKPYYSVTYGNTYVAVIDYNSGDSGMKAAAQWLAEDAAASKAQWKIVLMHQPSYNTNPSDDSCAAVNKYIPAACDAAGIDFVFSGHNHSYARTVPLVNNEENAEGTVYITCGSTGEKSYSVASGDYLWAGETVNGKAIPTNDFDGLYLTVDATETKFTVTVHEKDGSVFDTYTKDKSACADGEHSLRYNADDNRLECSKCEYSRSVEGFTGMVRAADRDAIVYLVNGELQKNRWVPHGEDNYYVGDDGFGVTGTQEVDGIEYTFDEHGKCVHGSFVTEDVTAADGSVKTYTRYYGGGEGYATGWTTIDGDMYCFNKTTGNMYKGKDQKIRAATGSEYRYFTFSDDGKLLIGAFVKNADTGKVRYYWGDDYVKDTTVTVNGVKYAFNAEGNLKVKKLSACSIASLADMTYTGKALTPKVTVKDGSSTLSSEKTSGKVQYNNYTVKYTDNTKIGTATVTITGNADRGYSGKVTMTFKIEPKGTSISKVKTAPGTFEVSWNKQSSATTGYQIRYATNSSMKDYKTSRITSTSTLSKKVTGLKAKSNYYVQVRTYTKVGSTYYYSDWSKAKSISASSLAPKGTSISKVKGSTGSFEVTWKKQSSNTAGYQIRYSTKSDMKSYKTSRITSNKTTVKKVSKLKKKTKYYVQVRTYTKVGGTYHYSDWSKVKSVKTK